MTMTKTSDIIIPEVIADGINQKLGKAIRLAPLCDVNTELQGSEGDTLKQPSWTYIGDAKDVAEGVKIEPDKLSATAISVKIKKAVKDVELTDETILATQGKIIEQAEKQITVAVANKIDEDLITQATATQVSETVPQIPQQITGFDISQQGLATLRMYFGEDMVQTYLIVSVQDYQKILSLPEFVAVEQWAVFMNGYVGQVMGLNIVVTSRLEEGNAILMQQGGLGIALKRSVHVESAREMETRSYRIGADAHYSTYVKDASKVAYIRAE